MIKQRPLKTHDKRKVFASVLSANSHLNVDDIGYICDQSKAVVENWFSGTQEPDNFALMQLHSALYIANMVIPLPLSQLANAHTSRVKYWAGINKTENKKPVIERVGKPVEMYIFDGQLMTITDITSSDKCKIGKSTLRARIRANSIRPGQDVTELAVILPQQGKKLA